MVLHNKTGGVCVGGGQHGRSVKPWLPNRDAADNCLHFEPHEWDQCGLYLSETWKNWTLWQHVRPVRLIPDQFSVCLRKHHVINLSLDVHRHGRVLQGERRLSARVRQHLRELQLSVPRRLRAARQQARLQRRYCTNTVTVSTVPLRLGLNTSGHTETLLQLN